MGSVEDCRAGVDPKVSSEMRWPFSKLREKDLAPTGSEMHTNQINRKMRYIMLPCYFLSAASAIAFICTKSASATAKFKATPVSLLASTETPHSE